MKKFALFALSFLVIFFISLNAQNDDKPKKACCKKELADSSKACCKKDMADSMKTCCKKGKKQCSMKNSKNAADSSLTK